MEFVNGEAYDSGSRSADFEEYVPDEVKAFLAYFCDAINSGESSATVAAIYDTSFPKLTEEYFRTTHWPEAELIAPFVNHDQFFLLLYKELYYRHIFASVPSGPTVHERLDSYANYCDLFNCILGSDTPVNVELPNLWLWEIVDEFIYQFQSFQLYRAKLSNKTEEEMQRLMTDQNAWSVLQVLNCLHSMVEKSEIGKQLNAYAAGINPDSVAGPLGWHSLYKMMGYFSLVALLRLHSLMGDYHQSIKVLNNIDCSRNKALLNRVPPGCQVTMAYYLGFAYVMIRRYSDAIRVFTDILTRIQRMQRHFEGKSYQHEQIKKQTEQMYTLLSICLVLHPQRRMDESILSTLTSDPVHSERMRKMAAGSIADFEAAFVVGAPKFLSPLPPPSLDDPAALAADPDKYVKQHRDALRMQVRVFMDEVRQQMSMSTVRSYLKLYTSMPMDKLASYMGVSIEELGSQLMCYKHKMMSKVVVDVGEKDDANKDDSDDAKERRMKQYESASGLDGQLQSNSDVEFYIDGDMIHIGDMKVDQRVGDYFIRHIQKLTEVHRNVKNIRF